MQLLPNEILDWVNAEKTNLEKYADNGLIGCFLEIYLNCPGEFYGLNNDYPIAVEKIKAAKEILSQYQSQIIKANNFSLSENERRIYYLENKNKYKLYCQNLKIYLNLGLQLNQSRSIKNQTIRIFKTAYRMQYKL